MFTVWRDRCHLLYQKFTAQFLMFTSISANADGPRDAASRKIDHNALPTEYSIITKQRVSVDIKLLHRLRNVGYYHIFEQ